MNDVLRHSFYIIIALVAVVLIMLMPVKVLLKEGLKKSRIGTICRFGLLIWAMGYWDESIQTTTLVIVSTLIALILVFRWEFLLLEVKQLM
jgi:glycine betaine/proline transport system permease protein